MIICALLSLTGGGHFSAGVMAGERNADRFAVLSDVVEVAGRQGVAADGLYYYVSGSAALYKYSLSGELLAVNERPFEGLELAANHIGDIDVWNGEIYTGIETFKDGQGKNIQIAVYDSETLKYKYSIPWSPESGQVEVCGLAVDTARGRVWMADWVRGDALYCYDLASRSYVGKVRLNPAPALQQGICFWNGSILISSDDGDAGKNEADHLYICEVYDGKGNLKESAEPSLFRTMTDFRRAGEIEGLTVDPSDGNLVVLSNRGSMVIKGMPSGFCTGYDREVHELYVYGKGNETGETVFYDALQFPLFGRCLPDDLAESSASAVTMSPVKGSFTPSPIPDGSQEAASTLRYRRLPQYLEGVSRKPVWSLGCNSAGLYIRFRTNSTEIYARWTSATSHLMNHMTAVGSRGLDLYAKVDGEWRFAGSGRPKLDDKATTFPLVRHMEPEMREYMLYLSLYKDVESLSIGVDMDAEILGPELESPKAGNPVVFYGTSILQGGCANRPGMAFTNIIARRLDRETVNMGFSGNALLDMEIAELMAKVENPALYVLDYVPNASADMIKEHGEEFFRVIRNAHPDVPVIFVEDPIFPHSRLDKKILGEITRKNVEQKSLYERLKTAGEKHIYFVSSEHLIGDDGEATVDGVHFTDLGMVRYADCLTPVIQKALRKAGK